MRGTRRHRQRITRDALFVAVGLSIIGFEVVTGQNNPMAMAVGLLLMGLPVPAQLGDKLWRATTNQHPEGYYRHVEDDDEWDRRERPYQRLESGQRRPSRHRPPTP